MFGTIFLWVSLGGLTRYVLPFFGQLHIELKWTISRYWTCSLVFLLVDTSSPLHFTTRSVYIYNYIVCWHFFHSSILCFFRFFWFIGGAKQRDGDVSIPRWKPSLLGDVSQCLDSSLVKLEIQEAASIAPPVRMQSLVRMVIRMTEFTRKPFFLRLNKKPFQVEFKGATLSK